MKSTRCYTIERDEYGYSIYDRVTRSRVEHGSPHRYDIRRRLVELEAYQTAYSDLIARGYADDAIQSRALLASACNAGRYYGRVLANVDTIAKAAIEWYLSLKERNV